MKTLSKLLALFLFFSFTNSLLAQKKTPNEIMGIKILKERNLKGKSNEYRIEVYEKYSFIYNKRSVYEKIKPNYTVGDFEYIPIASLSDEDLTKLKQFTNNLIGDYVFRTSKTWQYGDCIDIRMLSNMQGNVKDVTFAIPNALTIPIDVIEQLEAFVKKDMKLYFKINHTNQNANYIYMTYGIALEPMRKARKMKGQ